MNISPVTQAVGNVCVALAALVLLLPLARLLGDFADKHPNDDHWVTSALYVLIPLWLLLMGALLCVTASAGFDGLRLGRPALYALTVAASLSVAAVWFVFIGLYIRPGFTPRVIYVPMIYLIPLATMLLVVLSLNQKYLPGVSIQWLRWPWTIFAALSLVGCVGFFGPRLVTAGLGGLGSFVDRVLTAREKEPEHLAKIATLDPQRDFDELLNLARGFQSRAVREAATARLRTHPAFVETLAAALEAREPANVLEFLHSAVLSPEEQKRLALPARTALERFIEEIPAPNYIPRERQKKLLKWGRKTFPVIIGKFSASDVNFSEVMPKLENALRPDDTRR